MTLCVNALSATLGMSASTFLAAAGLDAGQLVVAAISERSRRRRFREFVRHRPCDGLQIEPVQPLERAMGVAPYS
jgi:hypothetical protein